MFYHPMIRSQSISKPVLMGCDIHNFFSFCLFGFPSYERGRSAQAGLGISILTNVRSEELELGILFHRVESYRRLELCITLSLVS